MAEQTLNIPQLLAVILVGFLIIRWFFYSSSTSTSTNPRPQDSRNAGRRADPRQVDQIAQMFPQVGRREIQWDLQRNGGSPAATTERILSGRPLEVPPPSFQPQPAQSSSPTTASPSTPPKPIHPDLITRYNLASKLSEPVPTSPDAAQKSSTGKAWSQNKNERQALLQRRREEMILAARRKLEEKDRMGGAGG
ncbi:MAG: hypothetical protein M1830_004326 [Pleopsidium flavum]|nr:MAG: hypothetical protein M1830_004326 [Pleopsidium flavum]